MQQFFAYIKTAENYYSERFGLDFEEFTIGQNFKHRPGITLSQQDNKTEALTTINNAQLHYDSCYAAKTEWEKCLTVSTLTLQYIVGMTWKTFAKKQRIIAYDDITMIQPVFAGDTLYAESEIVNKEEYSENKELGILHILTRGINQNGNVICKIRYKLLVYKADKHPLDKNLQRETAKISEEKFLSHRQLIDGSYMEEVGIYYENFQIGETYEHFPAKTFTAEESRIHSLSSLEWNPQYADLNYIKKYNSNKFIINETFLIGAISALTTRTFGRVVANLQWKNISLPRTVYAGETIFASSTIIAKRKSKSRPTQGIIQAHTCAYNQEKELVCSFERCFLVYKNLLGPYFAAGY